MGMGIATITETGTDWNFQKSVNRFRRPLHQAMLSCGRLTNPQTVQYILCCTDHHITVCLKFMPGSAQVAHAVYD